MKILFLAPLPPPDHGGMISWTRLVKKEFARRPAFELRFVDSAMRYRDVTNLSVLLRIVFGSAQAVRDCLRVFCQIRFFHPDIFHLCTSGGPATLKDAILVALMRQFNIPVVIHYHMGRLPQILASQSTESRMTRYVLKASSAVFLLGAASENAVRNAAPDQYVVNLSNMVDMDEIGDVHIFALPQEKIKKSWNITFVGHVVPAKGIEKLVRACAALYEENLELYLVGPCSETFRNVLVNAAQEGRDDSNWLKFYGKVDHAEALRHIARCDLFVLPSYTEGAPNVILEAMSMGKPILSTLVGAVPEMLAVDSDKPCGVCIAPKCADSILKAIKDFLGDPLKWHQFASNARCRAERLYASPVICDQLADTWHDISLKLKRLSFGPAQSILMRGCGGAGRALSVSKTGRFYASNGYNILCSDDKGVTWHLDAIIHKGDFKAVLAGRQLLARLLRYYVAALGVLSDGTRIAVARDGVYRVAPEEVRMQRVFEITRGSRPLNITIDDSDRILFGEYGDLPEDREKFIYASDDGGASFHVVYSFPSDDIRHVHNVIWDRFDGGYWVMVGDFDKQPGIGKLSEDFKNLEWVRRGDQKVRAVGVIVEKDCLYYGTDSELSQNYIVRMDKKSGHINRLRPVEGSSLYATRFGDVRLISTCVEPSSINRSRESVIYASVDGNNWHPIQSFNKDLLDARLFQFGTVVLPTSDYHESVGMFSGQALAGCDNQITLIRFENGSSVKQSDTGIIKV